MASMTLPSIASVAPYFPPSGVLRGKQQFISTSLSPCSMAKSGGFRVSDCLFNPNQQPILKEALSRSLFLFWEEYLQVDLNEGPSKEWVARTVESSGITEEQVSNTTDVQEEEEDMPVQIEIE